MTFIADERGNCFAEQSEMKIVGKKYDNHGRLLAISVFHEFIKTFNRALFWYDRTLFNNLSIGCGVNSEIHSHTQHMTRTVKLTLTGFAGRFSRSIAFISWNLKLVSYY